MSDWPDGDRILGRFREWLDEVRAEADVAAENGEPFGEQPESRSVGLYQLIEEFTALRHELKLQTKSGRSLEERSANTLDAMHEAIAQFRSVEAKESEAAERAAKPLIDGLLDLHESLERGRAVIETARRRVVEESAGQLQGELDELHRRQAWWRRWIGRRFHAATRETCARQAAGVHAEIFDSLIEGYGLIQKRLQRVMDKEQIHRVDCVGKPVDPNSMNVIEVVDDPSRPPGLVIEEVRPGYYWKARVFRFAEVRAVRGRAPTEA